MTLVVGLASVALTLPYLGQERFAAWAMIVTVQVWMQLADFGITAGVTTPLIAASVSDDKPVVSRIVRTALVSSAILCFLLFVLLLAVVICVDLGKLLNFEVAANAAEFERALIAGTGLTLLAVPSTVVVRALSVSQRGHIANLWLAAGQLVALICLVLCARFQCGLYILTVSTIGSVTLAQLACLGTYLWRDGGHDTQRQGFDWGILVHGARTSLSYWTLQLAGMLLLNSTIFVVSFSLTAASAAEFAALNRIASLCPVVAQLTAPYFWVAYGDAIARREVDWLGRAFKRHLVVSIGSTALLAAVVYFAAPLFLDSWVEGGVVFDAYLLGWLLIWQLVIASMNPSSALLNAHDSYAVQSGGSLLSALVGTFTGYLLSAEYGTVGIVAALIGAYLVFTFAPVCFQINRLISARP